MAICDAAELSICPRKYSKGLNFGSLQRDDSFSAIVALVALGLDRSEFTGFCVVRLSELALPNGQVGDRLRCR
jgi:hypothetical protein